MSMAKSRMGRAFCLDRRTKIALLGLMSSLVLLAALEKGLQFPPGNLEAPRNTILAFQISLDTKGRDRIVDFWQANEGTMQLAYLHLAIDSLILVPAYSLFLLGILAFLQRSNQHFIDGAIGKTLSLPMRHHLAAAIPFLPGAFDLLENALTLQFLHAQGPPSVVWHYSLATAAWLKWCALLLVLLVTLLRLAILMRSVGVEAVLRLAHGLLLRLTEAARFCLLAFYPLLFLALGLAFLGFVPQSRDILFSLANDVRANAEDPTFSTAHLFWAIAAIATWLVSIGIGLQLLEDAREQSRAKPSCSPQGNNLTSRAFRTVLTAFAFTTTSCFLTVFISGKPSLNLAFIAAAGCAATWLLIALAMDWWTQAGDRARRQALAGVEVSGFVWSLAILAALVCVWLALDSKPADFLRELGWSYQRPFPPKPGNPNWPVWSWRWQRVELDFILLGGAPWLRHGIGVRHHAEILGLSLRACGRAMWRTRTVGLDSRRWNKLYRSGSAISSTAHGLSVGMAVGGWLGSDGAFFLVLLCNVACCTTVPRAGVLNGC